MNSLTSPNIRRAAAACAIFLAALSASGARLWVPHLGERVLSAPAVRTQTRRTTETNVRATAGAAQVGGRALALLAAFVVAWVYAFPFFVRLPALRGLVAGACSHDGTPKCRRGLSLGGHGRIGAG